jgi:cell division septum initiation protein DivIVA
MDNGSAVQSLLDKLYALIDGAKWFPVGQNKCILDKAEALDLLDQVRREFPVELVEAQRLVAGRRDFIANARREADTLRKSAEERSRQLVDEQEVLRIARAESRDIIASAQNNAANLKKAVTEYVEETLKKSEAALGNALSELSGARRQFEGIISRQSAREEPEEAYDEAEELAEEDEHEYSETAETPADDVGGYDDEYSGEE